MSKKKEEDITVVFCTRETDHEKMEGFMDMLQKTAGCEITISMVSNPDGVSLSQVYGDVLESDYIQSDIVVFVHDDIEFLRDGWGTELIRLFKENKKYGIIGVAGSAQFDQNGGCWKYEKRFGQVLRRHDGKSWLSAFSPLLQYDLQEVAVIDGLFIAINKTRITQNFVKDIDSKHMYDIAFCLANLTDKNNKYKIGVTTNIRIAHNSIGELDESWYKAREQVNEMFGKFYPIDVTKDK